ncbi:MAG: dihydroorotate dehydrogenase [Actinomycetota bacterium]
MTTVQDQTNPDSIGPLVSQVGSVTLQNPVMLASGTAGHGTELSSSINLASVGALVVKSLSAFQWEGNTAPRLHETPSGMINSIGLQGPGLKYWIQEILPDLISHRANIVLSIWGRTINDYYEAAEMCNELPDEVVAIELNISCPNVEDRGNMFAHSPESTEAVIKSTENISKPRWAKLSPNVTNLVEIAAAAKEAGVEAITLINTLMGMVIDIDKKSPLLGGGGGGLSGPAIRPVAIRSVFDVHRALPELPIIGVGGIASAKHVVEFMMAGASAVQIGTANFANPKISELVIHDLEKWCKDNEVNNLNEIIGVAH